MKNTLEEGSDAWSKDARKNIESLEITVTRIGLQGMSKEELGKKINEWDPAKWREAMNQKSSLRIYRQNKEIIEQVDSLYDNRPASMTEV